MASLKRSLSNAPRLIKIWAGSQPCSRPSKMCLYLSWASSLRRYKLPEIKLIEVNLFVGHFPLKDYLFLAFRQRVPMPVKELAFAGLIDPAHSPAIRAVPHGDCSAEDATRNHGNVDVHDLAGSWIFPLPRLAVDLVHECHQHLGRAGALVPERHQITGHSPSFLS